MECHPLLSVMMIIGLPFWSNWEVIAVFSANSEFTDVVALEHGSMEIQKVHSLQQSPELQRHRRSPCDSKHCLHDQLDENGKSGRPEYLCPENHYLAKDGVSCISNCTSSQFLCKAGSKCIPFWWSCDGVKDCDDGSDEPENCGEYYCKHGGIFQCANASSQADCILPTHVCDGVFQCADESDEQFCSTYTCMDDFVKCHKDNKCIPKSLWCDGKEQCSDGEDEKNCASDKPKCGPGQFRCNGTGRCIPQSKICDGSADCGEHDLSDEDSEECHSSTCLPDHYRCLNDHCIIRKWRCDSTKECQDGSDEFGCENRHCRVSEFRCDDGQCIPLSSKCNGHFDCNDHSDEVCDRNCTKDEFICKDFHCIPKQRRCDGDNDCGDDLDEENCATYECMEGFVKCQKDNKCIPKSLWCDGKEQCSDGEDEKNCHRSCTKDEFTCNNFQCILRLMRCNGDDDCSDGSDEENCATYKCMEGFVKCQKDNKCIPKSLWCDGKEQCSDGEDEKNCHRSCTKDEFTCNNFQCILRPMRCNGDDDCGDGSDEENCGQPNTYRSESCLHPFNGGCDHHCKNGSLGPVCSCKEFFALNSDGLTCSLDNPCLHYDTCSQHCTFDEDLLEFTCSCAEGYEAVDNSCKAIGSEPEILLAQMGNVLTLASVEKLDMPIANILGEESKRSFIISVDVDISAKTAFFINRTDKDYYLMKKTGIPILQTSRRRREADSPPEMLLLQDRQLFAMQGVAVDWVAQHIYLTDATNGAIHVYNYDGQRGKTVIKGDIRDPYAIAVDPLAGRMFWVDRGQNPKIESADLDGSNRKVIVSTAMSWPNGLALDTNKGWVYWADTKKHTVEVARFDGSDRKILYTAIFARDPPLTLEVFEDAIYVLTYKKNVILKLHRFDTEGEKNTVVLFNTVAHARDIKIVQENKHIEVKSNCTNSCEETQICFNKPQHPQGYVCLCPDGTIFTEGKCNFAQHQDCENYCLHGGTCEMAPVSGKPKCRCKEGYAGSRCESKMSSSSGSRLHLMIIIILVVICVVLIAIVAFVSLKLYKKRWRSQYSHKSIDLSDNLNLSDLVFMKSAEEREPLDSSRRSISTADSDAATSNNFANPMYEAFHGDSQQRLMSSRTEAENCNVGELDCKCDGGTENGVTHLKWDINITTQTDHPVISEGL